MSEKPETALSRKIREALRAVGVLTERVHSGKIQVRRGWMVAASEGTPDIVVLCPYGWLEVKVPPAPRKRPSAKPERDQRSAEQVAWHARVSRLGVRVATVTSVSDAVGTVRAWQVAERAARDRLVELEAREAAG